MRIFICQVVPHKFIKKHNVSQAAATFCFDLIDNDCFDKSLSLIPINIKDCIKKDCEYYGTEFIQCRLLPQNHLFRFINNLIENITIVIKSANASTIWFYNITASNMVAVLILRFLLFKKVYAIIADFNPPIKPLSFDNLFKFIINKLSGIITLSARGDFKNVNKANIAGIIPSHKIKKNVPALNYRKFLFSGTLNAVNGIDMAIKVFSKIPNAELLISGKCNSELIDQIKSHKNIKYLGFLVKEDYEKVFSEVTFCLSFRNPKYPENLNNFPSKTLEYFSQSKVVISTIEYPELSNISYYYIPFNVDEIVVFFKDLLVIPNDELKKYYNHFEQINLNFSENKWKEMLNAIEKNELIP